MDAKQTGVVIPFLGFYLTDLVFINEVGDKALREEKLQLVIREIQSMQQVCYYPFAKENALMHYLILQRQRPEKEETLFELSYAIERRHTITTSSSRSLDRSGFFGSKSTVGLGSKEQLRPETNSNSSNKVGLFARRRRMTANTTFIKSMEAPVRQTEAHSDEHVSAALHQKCLDVLQPSAKDASPHIASMQAKLAENARRHHHRRGVSLGTTPLYIDRTPHSS